MDYTYTQILEKIKKFKVDSGIKAWCDSCNYPCLIDYKNTGYTFSEGSIYSMMDTCKSLKEYILKQVPDLFKKYVEFEINIRKALYAANIFEQHTSGTAVDAFGYDAAEVDAVFNSTTANAVKNVINNISNPSAVKAQITQNVQNLLNKTQVGGNPNANVESTIDFYDESFNKITSQINDPFIYDLIRKASSRFVHSFIAGKKRFNVLACYGKQISLPIEFKDYFKINFNTDTQLIEPFNYSLLTLDGIYTKEQHVKNIKAGRNKFIVFDALFATARLDSNDNIYYKFDLSTGNYLVRIQDDFFTTHRQWVILRTDPLNLNVYKTLGYGDIKVSNADMLQERLTKTNLLYFDLDEYRPLAEDTTDISFAIYGVPAKGFVIGTNASEPKLRFILTQ